MYSLCNLFVLDKDTSDLVGMENIGVVVNSLKLPLVDVFFVMISGRPSIVVF